VAGPGLGLPEPRRPLGAWTASLGLPLVGGPYLLCPDCRDRLSEHGPGRRAGSVDEFAYSASLSLPGG
jgi:hypothetical protein